MKTIIYYRKSTDRDDKQANSLEHQLNNCRNTAERMNLEVFKEIGESKSAKIEFKREGFNEMIEICKSKKIDYIICDEPKRLSRNNLDTSRLIDLLDKKQIKGILGTSREYHSENSRDKFLLTLDLSLSKMDNEDRGKDTKDKMITAFKKGGWMGKAPIGYKNVVIRKGHHEVHIDEEIAPIIKRGFELRTQGYSYTKVSDYFYDSGLQTASGRKFAVERVKTILNNKFYMGVMVWNNMEAKGNHKPLISKEVYYEATKHNRTSVITNRKRFYRFAGILKDLDGVGLSGYTKKGHIYYHQAKRSRYKISINERIVFDKFGEILKDFKLEKSLPQITLSMLRDIYNKVEESENINIQQIEIEIDKLKNRKNTLVDNFLDGDISKELYKEKLHEIELKILDRTKKLQAPDKISNEKLKKIKKYSELFVSTKKELHIAESRLLQLLKKVSFHVWQSDKKNNHTYNRMRLFVKHMINIYEKYEYIIQNINFKKL